MSNISYIILFIVLQLPWKVTWQDLKEKFRTVGKLNYWSTNILQEFIGMFHTHFMFNVEDERSFKSEKVKHLV